MRILDRYISRRFLSTLLFALVAFISIFIIVDLIEKLDRFIDLNVPKLIIIYYYLFYIPYIIVLILPVAMLLASLFSVGQLARYNELTAMKASGLSVYRILLPLFVIALLISVAVMYFGEKIVPVTNHKLYNLERVYLHRYSRELPENRSNIYLQDIKGRWIIIGFYDDRLKKAYKVSIQNLKGNSITERIDASQMVWKKDNWVLINGYHRHFFDDQIVAERFDRLEKKNLQIVPEDLARVQKKPDEMNYSELKTFIEEVKKNGGEPQSWLVDLYLKISFPFANFIIVFFGAPLSSSKHRSGAAVGFGISLFICFIYFGLVKTGQTLGHSGVLHPMLAAWLGNIVFIVAGIFILIKVRK